MSQHTYRIFHAQSLIDGSTAKPALLQANNQVSLEVVNLSSSMVMNTVLFKNLPHLTVLILSDYLTMRGELIINMLHKLTHTFPLPSFDKNWTMGRPKGTLLT